MFIKSIYPEITLYYRIILDTLNLFWSLNKIDPHNKVYNTFLLDENNHVLSNGYPLKGSKSTVMLKVHDYHQK